MRVEILMQGSVRGQRMLRAMADAAPMEVVVTQKYEGSSELLMLYGVGHPYRHQCWTSHPGRKVCWDLGYWDRQASMRMSVDAVHPQHLMVDQPPERWRLHAIKLRNDYRANGPILLVGMGEKSRAMLGMQGQRWERKTLNKLRRAYPAARIVYRPKRYEVLAGCETSAGPIEDALKGASLVVCRHSNVAVDACIAGVPVVCWDGAASALYGSDVAAPVMPSREERQKFLERLAWWQWKPEEASDAWKFLLTVCAST